MITLLDVISKSQSIKIEFYHDKLKANACILVRDVTCLKQKGLGLLFEGLGQLISPFKSIELFHAMLM